mgnify:CR=1 FL=1
MTERQMPISFTALPLEDRRNLSSGIFSGSRVLVIGRVQNNNYTTKEGSKVYGFSIITEEVEFAQKKSAEKPANKDSDFSSVPDEEQPVDDR